MRYSRVLILLIVIGRSLPATPDVSIGGDLYGVAAIRNVLAGPLNPRNSVQTEADHELTVDIRPEARLTLGETSEALVRPRWRPRFRHIPDTLGGTRETIEGRFQFDEASLRWDPSDEIRLVAGVHYYMWGPGELLSPSNPMFHFQWDSRSVTFRQRGQIMLRTSWSPSANLGVTALVEPVPNGESKWLPSRDYEPRALVRCDVSRNSGEDSAALVVGRMDGGIGFVGWSGATYLFEGISLYADARHTLGLGRPSIGVGAAGNAEVVPAEINSGRVHSLGLLGLRYEGFFDTRLEYIYNDYGASDEEYGIVSRAAGTLPGIPIGGAGTELPRTQYLFVSLRTDRLGRSDELRVAARYLHSLSDHSGALFAALEHSFAERWTLFLEPGMTHGASDGEFRQSYRWELRMSVRAAL